MKILTIDIETSPNLADVWSLWNVNVGLSQLRESSRMLCFAAKWLDKKGTLFYSEHDHSREEMVQAAWNLLDEADAVIHYNGLRFDVKHLNREFAAQGLTPPSPYKNIDLLLTAKKRFYFPSNKLEYVSRFFGLSGKLGHEGHSLWVKCLAGDETAWRKMQRYNRRDVVLTEQLFHKMKPWINNLPNVALYSRSTAVDSCPACGSVKLEKRGFACTALSVFQQYKCKDCGRWLRGTRSIDRVQIRESA